MNVVIVTTVTTSEIIEGTTKEDEIEITIADGVTITTMDIDTRDATIKAATKKKNSPLTTAEDPPPPQTPSPPKKKTHEKRSYHRLERNPITIADQGLPLNPALAPRPPPRQNHPAIITAATDRPRKHLPVEFVLNPDLRPRPVAAICISPPIVPQRRLLPERSRHRLNSVVRDEIVLGGRNEGKFFLSGPGRDQALFRQAEVVLAVLCGGRNLLRIMKC